MDHIFKIIGVAIITVILCLFVGKENKEYAVLLSITACCVILLYASSSINVVMTFVNELHVLSNLNVDFIVILLKAVGIGFLTEISVLICSDSGYSAIGKTTQIIGVFAILWVSLPLFNSLIDLLNEILGEI